MALAKCPRCNKIFDRISQSQYLVCRECEEEERCDFEKIRDLLQKEGNLNALQISEMLNISVDVILRMVEQGLIEKEEQKNSVYCGRCGKPAISRSKRLCEACLVDLQRECVRAIQELKRSMIEKAKRNELDVPEKVDIKKLTPKEKREKIYERKTTVPASSSLTKSKRMVYQEKMAKSPKNKKSSD
ncbi:MAG: hypothetical protein N3G21_04660 [Candidatus Hydrogenedentes bacterium]|nr:hypothetical protein [Candidatus Hydrogenedentota bacterium]